MSEGHKGICKVFASGKTCRFGKQCRYLHFRHPSLVSDSERRYNNGAVNNQRSASSSHSFKYQSSENFQEEKENEAVNTAAAFPLSSSHPGVDQEYVPLRYDKKQPSQNDPGKTSDKNVCRFYLRTGTCRFGKNCRFLHERHEEVSKDFAEAVHPSERDPCQIQPPDIIHSEAVGPSEIPSGPSKEEEGPCRVETCKFHLQGKCKFGDRCTKSHVIKDGTHEAANDNKEPRKFDNRRPTNRFGQDLTIDVSNATEDQKRQLRDKELHQLMRRYPKATRETVGTADSIQFVFHPSDPDWPFDVNSVEMKVLFPKMYPEEPMEVTVIGDDVMPKTLRRHIWKCAREWINTRFEKLADEKKAEIMYKPFHKWFDRNLEDIFTAGLKLYQTELMAEAAGIQLVAGSELQEKFQQLASDEDSQSDNVEETQESVENSSDEEPENSEENSSEEEKSKGLSDTVRRGTEIKLNSLQLKENTATLRPKKVYVIVRCGRCKEKLDLTTPPERLNCLECNKCHSKQYVTFRPTIAHQFSNVIGYLDLQDCTIFDMVLAESDFVAGCLHCNKEGDFGNLQPGQSKDTWCHSCHSKLKVAVESVKFLQLQPSDVKSDTRGAHVEKPKVIKPVKDPAIVEGKPLPDNGACKHYKKSFRWFRFPCCGKVYPCDLCHEENENHEMLFANRMICGFCAKEQTYAGDRPCKGCDSFMTRKSTEHWEGGKGCRDRVKMSRGDAKKYADQSKTISRKAQNSKPSGTKSSKLRRV